MFCCESARKFINKYLATNSSHYLDLVAEGNHLLLDRKIKNLKIQVWIFPNDWEGHAHRIKINIVHYAYNTTANSFNPNWVNYFEKESGMSFNLFLREIIYELL